MASKLLGTTLDGKFRLDEEVGSGAMGTVFRATQLTLSKTVAIKVMNRELAEERTYASRFKREAKAASRLEHPNSVRVIDFGDDDGQLYIAMEYLSGRDLLGILNQEWPITPARVVDLLAQTLAALAVAHEMGIVHRDLKPENVMVLKAKNDEGREVDSVKVCDFGVAKLIAGTKDPVADGVEGGGTFTGTGTLTATGALIGTPEYMSPEQLSGETLDGRSDLYSVGCILYQLLTRRLPFEDKSSIRLAMKHIEEKPKKPSSILPSVDPKLEEICLKALAKKPEERFASAREMRSELRAAVGILDPAAPPEAPPPSTRVVPKGAEITEAPELSKAATVLASQPPKAPAGTATEPSANQLVARRRRTWLALVAIVFAVGLLLALAR
jgi:serine/threonine-protein kinase